jgi:hypothetical protein
VTEDSLTRCVSEVRRAIGDSQRTIIVAVPRRGYRFTGPVVCAPDVLEGLPSVPAKAVLEFITYIRQSAEVSSPMRSLPGRSGATPDPKEHNRAAPPHRRLPSPSKQ